MANFVISNAVAQNSRLTISKEETRLKLSPDCDKERLTQFSQNIDNYLRTNNLIGVTLRGSFYIAKNNTCGNITNRGISVKIRSKS